MLLYPDGAIIGRRHEQELRVEPQAPNPFAVSREYFEMSTISQVP